MIGCTIGFLVMSVMYLIEVDNILEEKEFYKHQMVNLCELIEAKEILLGRELNLTISLKDFECRALLLFKDGGF